MNGIRIGFAVKLHGRWRWKIRKNHHDVEGIADSEAAPSSQTVSALQGRELPLPSSPCVATYSVRIVRTANNWEDYSQSERSLLTHIWSSTPSDHFTSKARLRQTQRKKKRGPTFCQHIDPRRLHAPKKRESNLHGKLHYGLQNRIS